ncbi:MAG TPA: type II toxin-antitoxin system VapB family antitoxin [Devosia sp.]
MKHTLDLDRQLLDEAKRVTGMKTYKATVDQCLRLLVELHGKKLKTAKP